MSSARKSVFKRWFCIPLLLFLMTGLALHAEVANRQTSYAAQLSIEGAIGPAAADYFARALASAEGSGAELIVIRMDTPGGLDSAMRTIIKQITSSPLPIATYVAPSGSRAASAGTYILLASHIAAMAPGTNVGAATPVQIGGISPLGGADEEDEDSDAADDKPRSAAGKPQAGAGAMQRKLINDAVAYIRGLAELHGRNQEWAEQAVREAASLSASEALRLNVIDVIADDVDALLQQIDGREVVVAGRKHTLQTSGLEIIHIDPDWRSRLLAVITNPNVAYILMLIGIYGLIFEFSNPGAIVPGTVGAICLLLALYAFQLLPINYAGVGLILLGVALMVAEVFEPSFGMLGIGGILAFVIGSIILMDTQAPGFGIDLSVIAAFAIASLLLFALILRMALKARRRPVVSGEEQLLGALATVVDDFERDGRVMVHGEHWRASSDARLHRGQRVKVTEIEGLTLRVAPFEERSAALSTPEQEK